MSPMVRKTRYTKYRYQVAIFALAKECWWKNSGSAWKDQVEAAPVLHTGSATKVKYWEAYI